MTKKEEKLLKQEELRQKRDSIALQLESLLKVKEHVTFPVLTGKTVKSKKFGVGTVGKAQGQYFDVTFESGTKKYALPDSFAKGFLEIEDESIVDSCKKYMELLEKEEEMKVEIKKLEGALVASGA